MYFLSLSLYSQYTSLWSVSNSPLTPVSQNGDVNNSLSFQFLRGSSSHYPSLPLSATVPSSGSAMYDSSTTTQVYDAAQYDASPHGRLPSAWTPVTPPSLWWTCLCKLGERKPWNGAAWCPVGCDLKEDSTPNYLLTIKFHRQNIFSLDLIFLLFKWFL